MTKKAPKPAAKATTKPPKPAKGVYVAPSHEDWGSKPALLKLAAEFGKHAAAVHKLQFDLRAAKARIKRYAEVMADTISCLHNADLDSQANTIREALES